MKQIKQEAKQEAREKSKKTAKETHSSRATMSSRLGRTR
jgi:hypothetical protein